MSDAFDSIKAGLEQAIAHSANQPSDVVVHKMSATDVKAVRTKIGMTQREFAASFGISLGTLRHWERGDRQPHGPARVLLNVLNRQPDAVLSALAGSSAMNFRYDARSDYGFLPGETMMGDNSLTQIFKEIIEQHLDMADAIPNGPNTELQRKILYLVIIDGISSAVYPDMENENRKRFTKTVEEFSEWTHCSLYSLPKVHKFFSTVDIPHAESIKNELKKGMDLLIDRHLRIPQGYVHALERSANPMMEQLISLENDVPADFIDNFIENNNDSISNYQKKLLRSLKHKELLYQYRNSLVHTLFPLGMNQRPEEPLEPHYEPYTIIDPRDLESEYHFFDLVYPVNFLSNIARNILNNVVKHFKSHGDDSLAEFGRSEIFWKSELNVDLELGEVLLRSQKK